MPLKNIFLPLFKSIISVPRATKRKGGGAVSAAVFAGGGGKGGAALVGAGIRQARMRAKKVFHMGMVIDG